MSSRSQLLSTEDDDATCCLSCKCSPKKDPMEFLNTLSLALLMVGMVIVTIAYLVPRDYVFDPDLPAAEMEAIEQYYSRVGETLDILIVIGTIFVASGGLIVAGIFLVMLIRGDFEWCYSGSHDDVYGDESGDIREGGDPRRNYGAAMGSGEGVTGSMATQTELNTHH